MIFARFRMLLAYAIVVVALGVALWQDRRLTRASAMFAAAVQEQIALTHELNTLDLRARRRAAEWEHTRRSANLVFTRMRSAEAPSAAERLSAEDADAARRIGAGLDLHYVPALKRLGVSADAIAWWREAVIRFDQRIHDIDVAARDQHLSPADPAIRELRREETAKFAAEEAARIGPDAHDQMLRISRLEPVTNVVEQLAGMVYASETPLTRAQGEELTDVIANASPAFKQGHKVVLAPIDWNAVFTQAQPVLSPTQSQALLDIVSDLQTRSELAQRVAALLHHS